jgi:hypothetical protein
MVFPQAETMTEYFPYLQHFQQMSTAVSPDRFSKPEMVVEVIFEAANDESDRMRYIAGDDAIQFITMREQQGDQAYIDATKKQWSPNPQ